MGIKMLDAMDRETFEVLLESSNSMNDLFKKLGCLMTSKNIKSLKSKLIEFGFPEEYLILKRASMRKVITLGNIRKPNDDIFVENSTVTTMVIKRRIISCNLIPLQCAMCQLGPEWNGRPLILQIDHINGIRDDNRLCNLRFLCPNCHTQTDTYAGRANKMERDCKICQKKTTKSKMFCEKCRRCQKASMAEKRNKIIKAENEEFQKKILEIKESLNLEKKNSFASEFLTMESLQLSKDELQEIMLMFSNADAAHFLSLDRDKLKLFCEKSRIKTYDKENFKKNKRMAWPSKEELEKLIKIKPKFIIAEELGVSHAAVNKKCRELKLNNLSRPDTHWKWDDSKKSWYK